MKVLIVGEKRQQLVGHILYDLMELGLLNEKGLSIVQNNDPAPDKIVDEITGSVNCILEDIYEEHVAISRCLGSVGVKTPIILSEPKFNVHVFARNTPMVVTESRLNELCQSKTSEIITKIEPISIPETRSQRRKRISKIRFKNKPL